VRWRRLTAPIHEYIGYDRQSMTTYGDALSSFITQSFAPEDSVLARIRQQIQARGLPTITVSPEEGRFLQVLVAASRPKLALEIGTLGGYSGTWIARGLPQGGRLITLELDAERAEIAREHFRLAGVDAQVEIMIGDAHSLLPGLADVGPFDFVFIDAEKEGYPAYLEWTLEHLRPGAVLAAHNAFRKGAILDPDNRDSAVLATREFNRLVAEDPRLLATIFPAGDGMTIAVLRGR
jgi:caffeoyl-CoA O-methyltransferase